MHNVNVEALDRTIESARQNPAAVVGDVPHEANVERVDELGPSG